MYEQSISRCSCIVWASHDQAVICMWQTAQMEVSLPEPCLDAAKGNTLQQPALAEFDDANVIHLPPSFFTLFRQPYKVSIVDLLRRCEDGVLH